MSYPDGQIVRIGPDIQCPQGGSIGDAVVASKDRLRSTLLGNIAKWRGHSRSAIELEDFFACVVDDLQDLRLARVNARFLAEIAAFLGFQPAILFASELNFSRGNSTGPGSWAPAIVDGLGGGNYLNPPGGSAFLEACDFAKVGSSLTFHQYQGPIAQVASGNEARPASILLQLLVYGRLEVSEQLDRYELHHTVCESES
jgi:hypothetical protein